MTKTFLLAAAYCILLASCGTAHKASTTLAGGNGDPEETINIGYGTIKKKDRTTSVSSLKVDNSSGYSDIYDYLKGRVAGVTVQGTTIRVRGSRSVLGDNDPLILVDGLEMSDLSSISPDSVDSIEVLKDASTAIYGARGANGVILITLKKAK